MAEFSKLITTQKGQALIAKVVTGEVSNIEFTNIVSSSQKYELEELTGLTDLSNIRQTSVISSKKIINNNVIELKTCFNNTDLTVGYYMCTLGVYAIDPDEGEILYAVAVETTGNCYMPACGGATVSGALITLAISVSNAEKVLLEVNPAGAATIDDINELRKELDTVSEDVQKKIDTANQKIDTVSKTVATQAEQASIKKSTLAAGATLIAISDPRITTDSALSFYTSIYGVNPTAVSVAAGKVTLTFDAQSAAMEVGVRVDG